MMARPTGAVLVALLVVLFCGAAPAYAFDRGATEATMLRLINHARTTRGLAAVKAQTALGTSASAHSQDMIAHDYFAHSSLAGASVGRRARSAGYVVGGWSEWSVGEVIAWGSASRGTPSAIFTAWMHSSSHRRIILGTRWRDVGIGVCRGTFKGISGVVMYTVDFGRRVQ
jgi:uncharacterized protein YkwD